MIDITKLTPLERLQQPPVMSICEWTEDSEDGTWETECGCLFSFFADGPSENNFEFCPFCGRVIKVVRNEKEDILSDPYPW